VPHLGGAEPVQELDAEERLPALYSSTGSASPAEVAKRREERSRRPPSGWATICWTMVGTLTRTVGRWRSIAVEQASGVQRSGNSTADPPTRKGKKRLEPRA
jgi:hypothetical protein